MRRSKGRDFAHPIPRPGTRTRRVWEIADAVTEETGRRAKRGEVVERVVAENGNPNTANTQYQYWKMAYDARQRSGTSAPGEPGSVGAQVLNVPPDGRFVIPLEMRTAMLLGEDGRVTARVEDGELRLISRSVAIKRMQREAQAYKNSNESVVDEFLAQRRAMWGED